MAHKLVHTLNPMFKPWMLIFMSHRPINVWPNWCWYVYAKEEWLKKLPPYQGGGEMISEVTFEKTTYAGFAS